MFWQKKNAPASRVESAPSGTYRAPVPSADLELDRSLEAMADVLRALGTHSFDVGDTPASRIATTFEAWASHVLVLGPAPGEEADGEPRPERRARDWTSLSRFVRKHRQEEHEHVLETAAHMRDAMLTFVRCLGRASLEQGKTSRRLRTRVDRLRASIESNSLEELKENALGLAETVTQALEEQERRMEAQARDLRGRLSRLQEDLDEAKSQSSTDALTMLSNRRVFDAALERSVAVAALIDRPLSLVMVDIDHFKSINDRFGHPVGDRVLRQVADALARSFPRRGDIVARYGGEEFACLLGETSQKDAQTVTERMLTTIRNLRIEHAGQSLSVTVSVGIGELQRGESGEEFVARVDRALYEAKRTGRDRLVQADPPPPVTLA